ncbi:PREDICTED: G-protein coupled receptor 35 isoform X5 [Myotis brandtii]|uniref:G-protein coupled receptor 35 isoform X5 n=1 Tax=Myotis brandtii TaxID=109478 RepID=UPI0007046D5E|nr:PREDICTED: G-protein coupled receptor 35 isoform X5 [Myotis brandtii]
MGRAGGRCPGGPNRWPGRKVEPEELGKQQKPTGWVWRLRTQDLLAAAQPQGAVSDQLLSVQPQGSPRTMNNSTCPITSSPLVTHIFHAYLGLLLVLGLLLNGLALWVFCCRLRKWTETHIYMVNLAAADLCLLCTLPFMLFSMNKDNSGDTVLCQLSQGIYLVNRYMSISLIMAIAVDRYVAVRHPLCGRGLRSPKQAGAVCAVLWVLVVGSLLLRWVLKDQEGGFCFGNPSRQKPQTVVFSLLGFYLPLAVLVFCSLQVVTALGQRPAADDVGQMEATRKAACMIWANLVVFVVCFLPLHVVLTLRLATGLNTCVIQDILHITSKVSDANCCLDAICYYYMTKEFQEASALAGTPTAKAHKSQDSLCVTVA